MAEFAGNAYNRPVNENGDGGSPPPLPRPSAPAPSELPRRLDAFSHLATAATLNPAQRIYVNRTLRFDQIRQVGFDMDYTLAIYAKLRLEALAYELTARRLIEAHGYPENLLQRPYDPAFAIRGLVVDKRHGNLFKMDRHHFVGRVFHGRRLLSKEERRRLYRRVKIRLKSRKYHWIDTLFALPEATLYADWVEHFDAEPGHPRIDYWQLFDQIREAIDEVHRDGTLKAIVQERVADFVEIDPELPRTLHRLRSSGKRLFLLTNSLWEYTDVLMRHLLDGRLPEYASWTRYFDVILVGAKKPGFFREDEPFFEVNQKTGHISSTPAHRFERHHVYQGGSLRRFESIMGTVGDEVLYVGDHIYGDIIRSKRDTLWRTALIVPELEDELRLRREIISAEADLNDLEERRTSLEDGITRAKLQIAAIEAALDDSPERELSERDELFRIRRELRTSLDRDRRDLKLLIERRTQYASAVDEVYNPIWGSLFKEGNESSAFARQVETYACVYTGRVSNFLYYSPDQYFRAPRHWLPHEKL